MDIVVKAILVVAIPFVAFAGGGYVMGALSDRDYLTDRFNHLPKQDQKGIGLRVCGYNLEAVVRHWGALDKDSRGLGAQRLGLEIDLLFPFLYGGALALSLMLAWATLGRPFHPLWLIAPVAVTVVADWIENLVQLTQLHRFASNGAGGLQSGWIQIASTATIVKIVFFSGSYLFVIALAVWLVGRAINLRT